MMDDREVLELAAKAAGIETGEPQKSAWFYCKSGSCGEGIYRIHGNKVEHWNPLTDDGDALRLAVKLGRFNGGPALHKAMASLIFSGGVATDPYAATRLAIVRAAAEIGKQMEDE